MPAYRKMSINYTGYLEDGTIFDENEDGDPLQVIMGGGSVMPPLMDALASMDIGDERDVFVPFGQAYGPYDEKAILTVARCQICDGQALREGQSILWNSEKASRPVAVKVVEASDTHVKIDFNHPLAGKNLIYRIRVVDAEN